MDSSRRNLVEYIVIIVTEFAKQHLLTVVQAYRYLRLHKGIALLEQNYDIAHTLSIEEVVGNLSIFCKRNGGEI